MPIKLNETLIIFRLPGPSEASLYEITFGRWPVYDKDERGNGMRILQVAGWIDLHIWVEVEQTPVKRLAASNLS